MTPSTARSVSLDADPLLAQEQRTDVDSITSAIQACALIGRAHRVVCEGEMWSARLGLETGVLPTLHVQLYDEDSPPRPLPEAPRSMRLWVDTGGLVWRFEVRCLDQLGPGRWRVTRPLMVEAER